MKSDFGHFQNLILGENVYTFQKPKMQHQLSTIRSGKTSQGASLQNFHFFFGYFTFYFALECCFCLSVFFCQLFPSGDFLGIFFFLRFHFWSGFRDLFFLIFVNSFCSELCSDFASTGLRFSLLHLTYYFIACKKIILKNTDHPLK